MQRPAPAIRARRAVLFGALVAWVLLFSAPARASEGSPTVRAATPATVSLSTSKASPNQEVTVTGHGWFPGRPVRIDLLPKRELGTAAVDGSGSFSMTFTIAFDDPDRDTQVVVTGFDSNGNYAYIPNNIAIRGEPASATVNSKQLTSGGTVEVHGRRFSPQFPIQVEFLPVAELGKAQADADGNFSKTFKLPDGLPPIGYQIVVTGIGMNGRFAYLPITVNVSGGGVAPPITGPLPTVAPASGASTASSSGSPTTKEFAADRTVPVDHTDDAILLAILGILAVAAIVIIAIIVIRRRRYQRLRTGST